ncbi:signal transduction histidine kinase [Actinoplanes lutulentus]|uniref:histidine kinase n=1 Tax=Actinoplanes lutulentus TaxID=1287878 RepID=A0A327Z9W4_9ACTN|nr:nitrate- and nitrite sensing domain-containing protein [Actinoplanes lutulentus]MBB2946881.1 signal transduction histidine kinase [Actinoplanes lutulentus]RAK35775.1 histidine kinase/DNA gyrase B/HSP90-like ATPase [Actinoplanes lutulentus]
MSVQAEGAELAEPNGEDTPAHARPRRAGGTIRRRVVRTLALPVATTLVLLTIVAVGEIGNYRSASATARAVTIDLAVQELIQGLQDERGLTAGLLGGNDGFRAELLPARDQVDLRRTEVEGLLEDDGVVEQRAAAAVLQLDGLAGVRAGTDTGSGERAATFAFYSARIADLGNLDFDLDGTSDEELSRGAAALEALGDIKEATAQERAFLNGVFSASGFKRGEFLQFVTMRSTKDAALTAFDRYANSTERAARDYALDTGAAREAAYFEEVALLSGDGKYLQVNPQSWWSAQTTVLDDMLQLEHHIGSVITARATTLEDEATVRMGVLLGAVLVCLAGSVWLATVASRSVARPLSVLANEANRLASTQLPEAVQRAATGDSTAPPSSVRVPRGASIEVKLVADAFDRVQATAYSLATEQATLRRTTAESLANLGRRNQNLLRRQLGFITKLEREESNPTGLANLFELDHLATRMRRNAESLLVLVGAASPRQLSDPLQVSDVIRAAVSEVEEYRRVTLRRVDDTLVNGTGVSGIAHMLAELIENGLAFSPPDVDVEIHGRRIGGTYLIAVMDQGIGMSPADMQRANERLRGEGDFITAPARFLGHYVVGRLALQMGIDVQLTPSPVTGVTARITLPAELLAEQQTIGSTPRPAARPIAAAVEPRRLPQSSPEPAPEAATTAVITADRPLVSTAIEYVVVDDIPAGDATAPRTVNGLRKRTPRAQRAPSPSPSSPASSPEKPAPVTDSPEAVRDRLNALRGGIQRGNAETARLP